MKTIVIGCGKMGQAVTSGLKKLGRTVLMIDKSEENLKRAMANIGELHDYSTKNIIEYKDQDKIEAVVSCLPYHENFQIAHHCINYGIKYFDLGGSVDVSGRINKYAKDHNAFCMTDLGLAPGYVNILLLEAINEFGKIPDSILLAVGGVPSKPSLGMNFHGLGPLGYTITWSLDGLLNEYKSDCLVLRDGKIAKEKGLSGCETDGEYEMFRTSGGISHTLDEMIEMGVKNCEYKTIRYKGHRDIVNFLINHCDLEDNKIKEIIEKNSPVLHDEVIIKVRLQSNNLVLNKEKHIHPDGRFSAMAIATGFPCAATVNSMLSSSFHKCPMSYKDVNITVFNTYLKALGL